MDERARHDRTLRLLEARLEALADACERSPRGERRFEREIAAAAAATRHAVALGLISARRGRPPSGPRSPGDIPAPPGAGSGGPALAPGRSRRRVERSRAARRRSRARRALCATSRRASRWARTGGRRPARPAAPRTLCQYRKRSPARRLRRQSAQSVICPTIVGIGTRTARASDRRDLGHTPGAMPRARGTPTRGRPATGRRARRERHRGLPPGRRSGWRARCRTSRSTATFASATRYASVASEGGLRLIYEVQREQGGICWRAAETREPQLVEDVRRDPDYMTTDESVRSEVAVPVSGGRGHAARARRRVHRPRLHRRGGRGGPRARPPASRPSSCRPGATRPGQS